VVEDYFPLKPKLLSGSRWYRGLCKLKRLAIYYCSELTKEEIAINTRGLNKQVRSILAAKDYDAVIIHYWYWGYLFKSIGAKALKIIDTHYVVEENLELFQQGHYQAANRNRLHKELLYSLLKQQEYFDLSDLIVVNSRKQADLISSQNQREKIVVAENGQDLREYLSYNSEVDQHSVLFYGALSSQFNRLALQRILKTIYPGILSKDPLARLVIVGSNPPRELIGQYSYPNMEVTGFVDDIKPHLARCAVMLLPLETGSGFRGRAIEVLALGVPIVGTENGLQSVGISHGIQGFITQSDEETISYALQLMTAADLRQQVSVNAREFVAKNYSLEATFGKLDQAMTMAYQELRG
jgi:glycosyltransferase involved in cell wall biosynthesis